MALRELLKLSFIDFVKYFFKELSNSNFIVDDFHNTIAKGLKDLTEYKAIFLNINIPPRLGKTELSGVMFAAWCLARNPYSQFIYVTASDKLQRDTSARIRKIIQCDEYKRLFNIELTQDQTAVGLWKTTQGGGLMSSTIKGQLTGFGAGRVVEKINGKFQHDKGFDGCVIFDDIDKLDDSEQNNANARAVIRTIFNTALTRTNAPDTPFINIQQRVSINDTTSNMLDYFGDEKLGKIINLVLPVVTDNKTISERLYPLAKIEKLRTDPKTANIFQSQFMQDPKPLEGLGFSENELKRFEKVGDYDLDIIFADPADRGNDYFSAVHLKADSKSRNVYVYEFPVFDNKGNDNIYFSQLIEYIKNNDIDDVWLESNTLNSLTINKLKESLPNNNFMFVNHSKNKEARVEKASYLIKAYFKFRHEQNERYNKAFNMLTSYQLYVKNQKDDIPDVLAFGVEELNKHYKLFEEF